MERKSIPERTTGRRLILLGVLIGVLTGYLVISPLAMFIYRAISSLLDREAVTARGSANPLHVPFEVFRGEFLGWAVVFALFGGMVGIVLSLQRRRITGLKRQMEKQLTEKEKEGERVDQERNRVIAIASTLPCGLSVISRNYEIEFMNNYMVRRFGDSAGKICYRVFRKKNSPCEECPSQRAMATLKMESAEWKRSDGTEVELVAAPLRNPDGSYSAVELVHDITERKKMAKELEQLAITDGLSGLYNRRQLNITLPFEIARARRQKHPLSLLFFDIDSFKMFNDRYGHQRGDEVLQKTGSIVKENIRGFVDSGYRYGGEEFVVILPEVKADQAKEIGERIRGSFKKLRFTHISISVGVVDYQDNWDVATFMRHADSAMYKAKGLGRDQVYIYGT